MSKTSQFKNRILMPQLETKKGVLARFEKVGPTLQSHVVAMKFPNLTGKHIYGGVI